MAVRFLRKAFLLPVYFYRKFISPALPSSCRYNPSCSCYFIEAVNRHGIFRGTCLGTARLFRCNGRFRCGEDPVPNEFSFALIKRQYRDFRVKPLK